MDDPCTDLTHIQWIIVSTTTIGIRMNKSRVFPGLRKAPVVEEDVSFFELMRAMKNE
jgi:hypothetical protein